MEGVREEKHKGRGSHFECKEITGEEFRKCGQAWNSLAYARERALVVRFSKENRFSKAIGAFSKSVADYH